MSVAPMFLGLRPKGECPIVDVFGDFVFEAPRNEVTEGCLYVIGFGKFVCFFFFYFFYSRDIPMEFFSLKAYISEAIQETPMGFGIHFNNFARNILT